MNCEQATDDHGVGERLRRQSLPLHSRNAPTAEHLIERIETRRAWRRTAYVAFGAVAIAATTGALFLRGDAKHRLDEQQAIADVKHDEPAPIDDAASADQEATEPLDWIVTFGDVDESGRIPLLWTDPTNVDQSIPAGYVPLPEVRQVPLWQLPTTTQDEIYSNWNEAGYYRTVSF